MRLDMMTWRDVDARINAGAAIMLPVGSTEQHGPMGMIGTDTICAQSVAERAADITGAIVAPSLAYTPAPFNTAFAGTVSLSAETFELVASEVLSGLLSQGFLGVFVMNGHGANLDPLRRATAKLGAGRVQIQSWWDMPRADALRKSLYGPWEGMHATPSEVAMTQALHGALPPLDAATPPTPLSAKFIAAHAGDKHGPPDEHRSDFPDGRVGSHSALATPQDGAELLRLASEDAAQAFVEFQTALHPTFHS